MFSKIQALLNGSSRRFYQGRLKDLQAEREAIEAQIKELEDRRDTVDVQIAYAEERV